MARMDRYNDLEVLDDVEREEKTITSNVLSRTLKNQDIYDDVYLNSSVVDINDLVNTENSNENKEEINYQQDTYEEKSYNVNDYIQKAHEKKVDDNLMRNLDNQDFQKQEDVISKLIASIEEKEGDLDFLEDLRGENEDTMIGGQLKTDEFNSSIYKTLAEEEIFDLYTVDLTKLNRALGDNTFYNLAKEEDAKLEHTFEKILESDKKTIRKRKKLPLIIFCITLFMLIAVIVLIILFK